MSKRIMLITQWFEPEPCFKGLLFAKELVARGFDVEVVTGFPNYPGGVIYPGYRVKLIQRETISGVSIVRVPLFPSHSKSKFGRIFNYLSFMVSSLIYGSFFAKRPNVIYAYHPPLTVGVSAILIKMFRRVPIVYDIQDMWPDTLRATGMVSNKHLLNLISNICKFVYRYVDKIVVLSPGFKAQLTSRGVEPKKIEVIYNWADEVMLRKNDRVTSESLLDKGGFNILFAGNIGQAQGLDVILSAAEILKSESVKIFFWLIGGGLKRSELQSQANVMGLDNVFFIPAVTMDKIGPILQSADALLIHLKRDPLFKITIPGKTQAYMAVGKPIIIGVEGDAANLVHRARCGITIEPESAVELANAAKRLACLDSHELDVMSTNASQFYDEYLAVRVGVDAFAEIFNKITEKK